MSVKGHVGVCKGNLSDVVEPVLLVEIHYMWFYNVYIILLTLFHVTPVANLFYVGGGRGVDLTPPSNFVILKDRDLKFGDNVHFWI